MTKPFPAPPRIFTPRNLDPRPHIWFEHGRWCCANVSNPTTIFEAVLPSGQRVEIVTMAVSYKSPTEAWLRWCSKTNRPKMLDQYFTHDA